METAVVDLRSLEGTGGGRTRRERQSRQAANDVQRVCGIKWSISRDSRHKRRATGGKRAQIRKKRKFELGRQAANTRIGAKRVHVVRVRGGNLKYRALRLETGNFAWSSEAVTRKARILKVIYNASNNELVRTNTLVKGAILEIDAAPFRQWYESHYALPLGRRKTKATEARKEGEPEDALHKKRSNHVLRKIESRKADSKVDQALADHFAAGRLYARISSRPGQSGRADGYILEGKELEFYTRKIKARKA
ncbi:40S ribosomal protein [Borealophlyctis nickersoniae]|nr:40S ribosomal protein [Borealophlyctis nickersoniae]